MPSNYVEFLKQQYDSPDNDPNMLKIGAIYTINGSYKARCMKAEDNCYEFKNLATNELICLDKEQLKDTDLKLQEGFSMSTKFKEFVNNINEGVDVLNEGSIPTETIVKFINWAVFNVESIQPPAMSLISSVIGIDYTENLADDPDFKEVYEKISIAYTKAKLAFIATLNQELKAA